MLVKIEYIASETIEISNDTPIEIVQIIVEDIVSGSLDYLKSQDFEAELKKIKRNP